MRWISRAIHTPLSFTVVAIAVLCSVLDALALLALRDPPTLALCGVDWLVTYALLMTVYSRWTIPLAVVAAAVVIVKVIPPLRSTWLWIGSVVVLSAIAFGNYEVAAHAPPITTDLSQCSF